MLEFSNFRQVAISAILDQFQTQYNVAHLKYSVYIFSLAVSRFVFVTAYSDFIRFGAANRKINLRFSWFGSGEVFCTQD